MVDMLLFAQVMKITEDCYNEDKPEEEKQHLNFADVALILDDSELSLDGEKLDLRPVIEEAGTSDDAENDSEK